jgi:hypothetical protein
VAAGPRARSAPKTVHQSASGATTASRASGDSDASGDLNASAASPKEDFGIAGAPATRYGADATGANAPSVPSLPNDAVGQSARIEQTGSLDLTVARGALSSTMEKLTTLAASYGGFVANSQTQSGGASGGPPRGTVTLQVPEASFSAVLKEAQSLGRTSQLTTKATNVTGKYVDLQSRITALQASRQQYLTIMTKANSIGDVLAVQAQLNELQSQIEQLQGQLNLLSSETTYSTWTMTLREPTPAHHQQVAHRSSSLAKAWDDSVHGFIVGTEGLVRLAGPALFAVLCLAALLLGSRTFWRRLQRHNL